MYEDIYKISKDKEEFIKLCYKNYKTKKSTADRNWYKLKKKIILKPKIKLNIQYEPLPDFNNVSEPSYIKKLMLEDFKRYKIAITYDKLKHYGFNKQEIDWCKKQGWL